MASPSRFLAELTAPDQCIGCGRCLSSCQVSAVRSTDAGIEILASECIGCGHCAVHCPAGVIQMKVKANPPQIPVQYLDRIYL